MDTFQTPPISRLASLDPPGMKRGKLPPVMKRSAYRYEERPALRKAPIYDTLPRSLIPSLQPKLRPPVMHYGWPVDFERLMKIAEELDLLVVVDLDDLVGDPDGPPEGIHRITVPTVDELDTIDGLLEAAGEELPPSVRQRMRLRRVINEMLGVVVSLYTNYDLATPVSDEFVEWLQDLLGEKERPRWYLDEELCYWRPRQKSSPSQLPTTTTMDTFQTPSVSRLASLDPPGMKRGKLPPVMKRSAYRLEERPALRKAPIYDTLPRSLIPSLQPKLRPPVMHYGWPANFKRLLEVAEELDLLVVVDLDDLVGDPDGPPEDIKRISVPTVDKYLTVDGLLEAAGEELPPSVRQRMRICRAINARLGVLVSLYTNYDLATPVSDEFVEWLQDFLGETERPRWYLDEELCYWRPRQKSS
ncbi:hypothetical protein B0H21DRAFT_306755 [Amylocystis lapponica]|nr:hypothetical protein B0H21DRAFT_306755 [Amylocystis lapponica]